jgi:hypothetical protein
MSADFSVDSEMHDLCRRTAFLCMVNDWCLANDGCQNTPCTCDTRFVQPDFDATEKLRLIRRQPAQVLKFPNKPSPQAKKVRALLAKLRKEGHQISHDPFVGAFRVTRILERAGKAAPPIAALIAELDREAMTGEPCADIIQFPKRVAE